MDWIMRPVLRGMCSFESIKSGEVDLCDLADMNDAIDVYEENRYRANEAAKPRS